MIGIVDTLWIIFYISLSILAYFISRSWYADSLTPLSIYVGVNSISISLYHLKLLPFTEISIQVHMILLTSIFTFFIAAYTNSTYTNSNISSTQDHKPFVNNLSGIVPFFYFTSILSTIGWMISLKVVVQKFGLSYLINHIEILQFYFQMQFIGYLNLIGILVLPTFILKRLLVGNNFLDILFVISSVIGLLLAGIKSYIIFSVVSATLTYTLLYRGRPQIIRFFVITVIIFAFFVAYNSIIDILGKKEYYDSTFPKWISFLKSPYVYITGSWPAMEEGIISGMLPPQPIFGYVTLQPLWKVLGDGLHLINHVPPYLPFVHIGTGHFNVFSFAGEVYWDYGIAGVIVFSYLIGYLSTKLYVRAREGYFWGHILFYSVFAYGVFISFFMYRYRFNVIFLLIYVYLFVFLPLKIRGVYYERAS